MPLTAFCQFCSLPLKRKTAEEESAQRLYPCAGEATPSLKFPQNYPIFNAQVTSDKAVITVAIRLRFDYDVSRAPASIRRDLTRAKNEHVSVSS